MTEEKVWVGACEYSNSLSSLPGSKTRTKRGKGHFLFFSRAKALQKIAAQLHREDVAVALTTCNSEKI